MDCDALGEGLPEVGDLTYMLCESLLMVNEKQHLIVSIGPGPKPSDAPFSPPDEVEESGFLAGLINEQLVKIAFWLWSKAIAPNFSQ